MGKKVNGVKIIYVTGRKKEKLIIVHMMKKRPIYLQMLKGLSRERLVLCVGQKNRASNVREKLDIQLLGTLRNKYRN